MSLLLLLYGREWVGRSCTSELNYWRSKVNSCPLRLVSARGTITTYTRLAPASWTTRSTASRTRVSDFLSAEYIILNFTEFNSDCVLVLIALDSGHSGLSGFPENPVNHWSVKGQSGPTLHGYPFGQVYLLDCRSGQVDPAAGMSGEGQGLDFAGALYYLNILLPLPPALVCFLFLAVLKYPSALVNNPI